jgi:GNAT superfamily N-acetyltransferase
MVDLYVRVGAEGLFVAAEPPIDRHERRLWLQRLFDAPWTLVLVATVPGATIGYLTAVGSERQPAAIGLGVAEDWRNRGVGTQLVKDAINMGTDASDPQARGGGLPAQSADAPPVREARIRAGGTAPLPLSSAQRSSLGCSRVRPLAWTAVQPDRSAEAMPSSFLRAFGPTYRVGFRVRVATAECDVRWR